MAKIFIRKGLWIGARGLFGALVAALNPFSMYISILPGWREPLRQVLKIFKGASLLGISGFGWVWGLDKKVRGLGKVLSVRVEGIGVLRCGQDDSKNKQRQRTEADPLRG
jgi:hypothetical protein